MNHQSACESTAAPPSRSTPSLRHLGCLIIAFQKQSNPRPPTTSSSAPVSADSITQSAYRTIKGPSLWEGRRPRLLRTHTRAYRQLFNQWSNTHTQHRPHRGEGDW